jgi:DNA replication and repair protein RecF
MFINSLELTNYRNYSSIKLGFSNHLILFLGKNGAGKTNLLESIFFLANGKSHKSAANVDLVRWGEDYSVIRAVAALEGKENLIEHQINADGKIKMRFNKIFLKNRQAAYKKMPLVIFSPDDLRIIKSSPVFRREFIDDILSKISPDFYNLKLKYQKILTQRNSLLKGMDINLKNNSCNETMDIWNESLVSKGTKMIMERLRLLDILKVNFLKYMSYFFKDIDFDIFYVFSWSRADLVEENNNFEKEILPKDKYLKDSKGLSGGNVEGIGKKIYEIFLNNLLLKMKKDILSKNTSIGPHRDDIIITIGGKDIRYFGSQGQQRMAAICLKLAELETLKENIDKKPVLLLDDVLSELDIERKAMLLKLIKDDFQTFITAANFEYIKDIRLDKCEKYIVENNDFKLL